MNANNNKIYILISYHNIFCMSSLFSLIFQPNHIYLRWCGLILIMIISRRPKYESLKKNKENLRNKTHIYPSLKISESTEQESVDPQGIFWCFQMYSSQIWLSLAEEEMNPCPPSKLGQFLANTQQSPTVRLSPARAQPGPLGPLSSPPSLYL